MTTELGTRIDDDTRTRATTAISSRHAFSSRVEICWRTTPALTSSSTIVTSLTTARTASCASCFAAVFRTDALEPVSSRRRSLSSLRNGHQHCRVAENITKTLKSCRGKAAGPVFREGGMFGLVYGGISGSCCSPLNLLSTFVTLLRDSHTFSQIADDFHNWKHRPFLRLRLHVLARQYDSVVVGGRSAGRGTSAWYVFVDDDNSNPHSGTSEAMLYHHVKLTDALSDMREGRNADSWLLSLENALEDLVDAMKNAPSAVHLAAARLVYTDCCLALAIANDLTASPSQGIRFLDKAIIVSGPSGPGRVEIVQDIIRELQSLLEHPDPFVGIGPRPRICGVADSTASTIPVLERHPSFAAFQEKYSNSPFIIRGFASSWPALTDHPWRSAAYLKSIAGPGRIVPVEVGEDYRSESWHQELMNWDEFLSHLDLDGCQLSAPHDGRKLYLAQYDLARQFPVLLDDILVPDYVYSVLCPEYKKYRPPQNAENLIINMWLGPAATMSPAHIVSV